MDRADRARAQDQLQLHSRWAHSALVAHASFNHNPIEAEATDAAKPSTSRTIGNGTQATANGLQN
jgi:hypothetical protein